MWDVWRVIVAFDQYAQWHPVLSLDATSEQVVVGAEIPAHVSGRDTGELDVTMRIIEVQAPHRLVWEGGSLEAILGRHSFVLAPQPDGGTEVTDSEEFFGAAAADVVPTLDQLREQYSRYGVALRTRVEGLLTDALDPVLDREKVNPKPHTTSCRQSNGVASICRR
jgi:hypothetical protein